MTHRSDTPTAAECAAADKVRLPGMVPFLLVHLACFGALWTGVHGRDLAIALALYLLRMFGITGGYHRYFSHRAYKTGRVFQFILAFLAQASAQRGALWWAAKHRHHHKYSDTELDVHSPRQSGFFHSHLGWIFTPRHDATDYKAVPDLARYPELVWLNRWHLVPAFAAAIAAWLIGGWSGLVVGFFWSTVATYHATFCINSLAHVLGRKRYLTGDDSRNNWLLAILTLGEGWHNNHHAYQSSTRQGFRWWEVDITYYLLKLLSWGRITWDLHEPPAAVIRNEARLGTRVIESAARQLAASISVDAIVAQIRSSLGQTPSMAELEERLRAARDNAVQRAEALVAGLHLPVLPTTDDLRQRAARMFVRTPSMDDIVERARQMVLEKVSLRLLAVA